MLGVVAGHRRRRHVTRALRVTYLDHCAQLSGGELALFRLLEALEGVDPVVILAEDGDLVTMMRDAGILVDVAPIAAGAGAIRKGSVTLRRLRPQVVSQWLLYTLRLARRLRRDRPDIVHTNSLKATFYGSVAAHIAGVPVVCHVRDRIAEDYLPAIAVRAVRLTLRLLADGVIANSASTMATVDLVDRKAAVASLVIHDAVPPFPSAPSSPEQAPPSLRVGMVGRIAPWKGQDVFLRAFAQAFPDSTASAVVIGAPLFGEEDFDVEVRRLAIELGIDERVTFTGFRKDVVAELRQLDVLVHASVIPEPFGMVVVEGMAAGLVVVAGDAGGPAEVVEDGVTGLLYLPGDINALAGALRRAANSPLLRARLGRAAQLRAEEFRPDVVAPKVAAFYAQILAAPRSPLRRRAWELARLPGRRSAAAGASSGARSATTTMEGPRVGRAWLIRSTARLSALLNGATLPLS